ncbi:ABC transporter ATP-binding protein [Pseudomonas sp. C2L12B]|uniref:ABC transporter ATP-binding protein n=1 Tax=Pseudomonas typographi TaxID=2715964 RepID=A0ABR7Z2P6_9PSED|nr:ABC transporter ATP-binding protein [Pseudomonas typographi]MBD1585907.1 ABC transporter ATP-binding protein [Pseudomonas typographi]MBD1599727.1 ABC transporter ATP-binding protein [Pseudomonas typographi]
MTHLAATSPDQGRAHNPNAQGAPIKLRVEGLGKRYGNIDALHALDLDVRSGELLTLLGASGSGKTTLLQIISGLVAPSSGRIVIDGRDQTHAPAHQRDIGVVFQNYALFPHLTVSQNVGFALDMRGVSRAESRRRINEALAMVGLEAMHQRFPRELSGGQQQRVALARCFIYKPSLILMDEPLSALDRKLRETMQMEIKRLHRETGSTIIFVTHDQDEALALSDRICMMHNGRIEQIDTPQAMYERPSTVAVARFIGISNVLEGTVMQGDQLATADATVALPKGHGCQPGTPGALVIRPEHLNVVAADHGALRGTVVEAVYAGVETRIVVRLASGNLIVVRRLSGQAPLGIGSVVGLEWPAHPPHFLSV